MSDHLAAARAEAIRLQHDYVGTEHLLLALLQRDDPSLATILTAFDATPAALRERLEKRSPQGRGSPEDPEAISIRSGARRALENAKAAAGGEEPGASHLLGALLQDGRGVVAASLGDLGIPTAKVREALGLPPLPERAPRPEKPPRPEPQEKPAAEKPEAPAPKPEKESRPERQKGDRREKERNGNDRRERSEQQRPERGERPERSERNRERDRGRDRSPPVATAAPAPAVSSTPSSPGQRRIAPVHEPWLTWRKLPLLAIPASLYLAWGGEFPAWLVFSMACLAVLPLAGFMGEATEHLAAKTGPALGGFLNATFGNAAELIIAVVALRAGYIELVKASIIGSILGNLLLILGLSIVAGGLHKPIIRFNRTAVGVSAGMLALAVTGLVFPAIFHQLHPEAAAVTELRLSESVAVVLLITYACSLLFSLKTHNRLFAGEPHPTEARPWAVPKAMIVLGVATVGVAVESEILVHAVEGLTAGSTFISQTFLGLIVIPIIGNAAEHATAVVVARKGKMDLALNIALGSSTQVALLIAPILVFIGAAMGPSGAGTYLNLVFTPLEVVAVGLSTILAAIITLDGESHWFEGVQLLALYAMVAIAVFFI
ncbi:MAG TPA: calcium/proton exchanger [Gemmatimonadales bacterium]|nr:calcium/proton exchanger [Gemmatimonadales bacterium]